MKSLKRLMRRMKPGKKKYKKTAGAVKNAYQNPTDPRARGEAAVRMSAAPAPGSQYVG